MSLISLTFAGFFIIVFALYFTCMKDHQWVLLLVSSLLFYAYAAPEYLIFLLISAVSTYLAAKGVLSAKSSARKIYTGTLLLNLLILVAVKYLTWLLGCAGIKLTGFSMIVPLGISYYTFIVIGYLTDVWRGVIEPESNFLKYLTFVSFFPHITQGPINRFSDLAPRLFARHEIDAERVKSGIYRIVCGLAKKLIIAERLSVYVDRVYAAPASYDGLTLLAASVFYAIQIYCDFSGYMDMVLGLSEMLGIKMAENFNLPYFAMSIAEFWRRWHITLGEWFKDYLYYSVLRSAAFKKLTKAMKKGKISFSKATIRLVPTVLGLLITWAATGIWHGASWHYGFWGLYHGILIILSMILAGTFGKIKTSLHINEDKAGWKAFKIIRTFILVDIGYVFFRAPSVGASLEIFKGIIGRFSINASSIANAILPFTEDNTAVSYCLVVAIAILVLFITDLAAFLKECPGDDFAGRYRMDSLGKYVFLGVMIVSIVLFGVFGQSSFIYMMY